MYRLLSARNFYQSGLHNLPLPSNNSVKFSSPEIKCSFCRKIFLGRHNIENFIHIRHQSTRPVSALKKSSKKKVKYKTKKRYGELLEVSDKSMTEMKVSINKLRADHLSKLAASSVSLGQLHQLTNNSHKTQNKLPEVDPELLQHVKQKLLNRPIESYSKEIALEDDACALVFTSHTISKLESTLKTREYIERVRESYNNFRKATLYEQRLQDLNQAIKEGINQEFDLSPLSVNDTSHQDLEKSFPKGPHAVFKEFFIDRHLDSYDHKFMAHISSMQNDGLPHPAIEELEEDLTNDFDNDFDNVDAMPEVSSLQEKKLKAALKTKKKAKLHRKVQQEINMKKDIKDIVAKGKEYALHKLLNAHIQLLCSLNMLNEAKHVLQYYRSKGNKSSHHPKVTDINIYNTLLHGYAGKGQYKQVAETLKYLEQDCIELNAQTFAAIFESVERSNLTDKESVLQTYASKMQAQNITLNDLLDKTKFINDQHEVVHKAILRLEPSFTPVYTPPDIDYVCTLLENLKLDNFEDRKGLLTSPADGIITAEELKERGRQQMEYEMNVNIEVKNIFVKEEASTTIDLYRAKFQETESHWRHVIKSAFVRNLETFKSQSNASHNAVKLYPYLKAINVDEIVELVMGEIIKLVDGSESYSPTLKMLQRELGSLVYDKYQIEQYRRNGVLEKIKQLYDKYCDWYVKRDSVDGSGRPYNCRQAWQMLVHLNRKGASMDLPEAPWPMEIRQNIGKFLYNIIINDIKIDVNMFKSKSKQRLLPAVYKVHRPWERMVRLELKPHPVLVKLCSGATRPSLRMRACLVPSKSLPAPWTRSSAGGYLLTSTPLIRMPFNVVQQWQRIEEAPPNTLYPMLDGLNQLGEVPWVINKPILDLQLQIFRAGGNKKLEIAPPPSALDQSSFAAADSKASSFRRRLAINRARAEMYSLWCDALYKLSIANHYRDDVFWLPHNMDFRGRVYACPPHLSQLGADSARALLCFAQRRPLGPDGLRWLKLHAINLTGTMKKKTVDERLEYADSIMDKILDSADRPLDGEGWWMASEEPWQTLACCKEIANAVRSPNPEEYLCGFPVHQDGSCNGLQHYAALGGDSAGAAAVNLAPLDRPQDVYSATAARVEKMRVRDAEQGVKAAVILENFVRRKVIKQTIMTTVYGVTRFGARLQIAKQLKDIDEFPKEHVWECSHYLTARTFDSLREMFSSTRLIQDWLTDCAKVISGVCGETVEWVTPLGLPVLQPYYRRSAPNSRPLDYLQRPCTMKQRNAFPANLIHSLDAAHMMLTALHCQATPIAFVSVHDCFWTHPDTVAVMNKICREQFVALHSQPILDDLSKFMTNRYGYKESEIDDLNPSSVNKRRANHLLKQVPPKDDFQLESVLRSVYFFS